MDTAYDNYTTTGDSMETVCSLELKNMDLPLFGDRSMRCILWKKKPVWNYACFSSSAFIAEIFS